MYRRKLVFLFPNFFPSKICVFFDLVYSHFLVGMHADTHTHTHLYICIFRVVFT